MVALDYMDKAGDITLLQTESNDFYGVVLKVQGSVANVSAAIEAGQADAEKMGGKPVATGNGIAGSRQDGTAVVIEVGSGHYQFSYPMAAPAKPAGSATR